MFPQMRGKLGEAAEGSLAEMMLDAFDIGKVIAMIESHLLKEIGQHGVTFANFLGHAPPFGRQRKSAIRFVAEKAKLAEPLDHNGGAGAVEAQGLCNIGDTGVALGAFQVEDALEVVLHALRHARAIMGASLARARRNGARGCLDSRPGHERKVMKGPNMCKADNDCLP